ncbi:hypothetical protein ONS96_011699 [Cadophora gregata f. sp. sojae]|nr:hypothetical protein ONS96_011699 [Cadophora gregata f. sp. sojae]
MVIIKCVWLSIAVACLDVVLAILGRTLACMRHPTLVYSSSYILIMTLGQATVDENQCAICISDFVADEEVRVLPCNHRYHPECIDPWLLNISGTCPVCRYDLRPNDPNAENTEDISIPEQPYLPVSSPIGYIRAEALRQEAARLEAFANPIEATTPAASPISPRERMSIRSRLREIRQASHTGPEYVAALGNFYRDRENRRPSMEAQRVAL